jgi:RHS repeat-associated protein
MNGPATVTANFGAAGPVPITIYSTGVVSSGVLAADGAVDGHYSLIGSADSATPGPNTFVVNSTAWPIPPWLAEGPNSKWIGPYAYSGGAISSASGSYTYRTTFNLTGLNPATAVLTGQYAADDTAVINLNGVTVFSTSQGFAAFQSFTINSGFAAGVNTLDFVVTNSTYSGTNPTGLRVDISGTAISGSGGTPVTLSPPGPISLSASQSQQQFAANMAVTWSISPVVGTISNGLYTAPSPISAAQAVTVTARSVADSNNFATATVNLTPAVPPGGPDLITSYTYDLLNHVTQVTMQRSTGTQTRTFNYNFGTTVTAYLQSATNPENGTVNYTYNGDGNLATKTDAKGQKIVYTWDYYKRLSQVQHYPAPGNIEDVCQRVTYYYDVDPFSGAYSQYGWGRRTGVEYKSCSINNVLISPQFQERYSYTPGGLVTKKRLTVTAAPNPLEFPDVIQSVSLDTAQTYDTAGKVLTVKYPDTLGGDPSRNDPIHVIPGPTYTYTYDGMARPITLTEDRQTPLNWVNNVQYGPAGELKSMDYQTATGMSSLDGRLTYTGYYSTETRTYNNRLQMTQLTMPGVNMEYRYSLTQNNGQITQQKDWLTGEEVSYQYDSLQRLVSAVTTGPEWGQSFTYDGFGNRTNTAGIKGTAPAPQSLLFDPATNRIMGGSYDANGNMLNVQGTSLGYDVENRVTSATVSGGTEYYGYAPDNKRIWKQKPNGSVELYFHGISGQKLGTYNVSGTVIQNTLTISLGDVNVYFGSKVIVSRSGPVSRDRLGSSRTGGSKYYPYGEEQQVTAQDKDKFATYFRDATGLDYAQNRYYANTMGTFTSPDPAGLAAADTADPRGWNMYAYVGSDPINHYDRTGLLAQYVCDAQFSTEECGEGDPLVEGSGNKGADGFTCDTGVTPFASTSAACSLYRAQIGVLFAPPPPQTTACRDWGCMPPALARALEALTLNADCFNLFGNANTRQGKWNPTTVLTSLFGTRDGKYGAVNFNNTNPKAGATTTPTGFLLPSLSNGITGTGANISINSTYWNINNIGYNAETLLHETGHLYNFSRGSGGFAVKNPAELRDDEAFDKMIKAKCGL